MRTHNGHVIDEACMKTLRDFWKEHKHESKMTFEEFIVLNTGWSHEEFILWVANGSIPK